MTSGSGQESPLPPGLNGDRLFSALLRSSSEGVILSRLEDATILEASDAFVEITGYQRQELLGRASTELQFIPEAVREQAIAALGERGWVRAVQAELRTKAGEIRHVEFSSDVLRDEAESYLLTVLRDVTERKHAEEELQRANNRFVRLFESTPIPTIITRAADGFVVAANPACLELIGWEAESFVGRQVAEVALWADPEQHQAMTDELRARGRIRRYETTIRTKNGDLLDVFASVELTELDGEQCLISPFYDITDRRKAEEAVRAAEERYRDLFENAAAGIFHATIDGRLLEANHAFASLLGYDSPQQLLAEIANTVALHDDPERRKELLVTVREHGAAKGFEARLRRRDGGTIWVTLDARPVTEGGAIVALREAATDVSERKRAEEAARRAQEEAERANEAKSRFLSHMSHELRTPLAAIMGFAELLQRGLTDQKHRQFSERILEGGRHLLQLVNGLLEISRIEAGQLTLTFERIDLVRLVDQVLGLVAPLAEERGIRIEHATARTSETFALVDVLRLKQVLLNLVSNAIKYNRDAGTVDVSLTETQDGTVRIAVADSGRGIPPDMLELLFSPFERLGAEQGPVEGSGLGLVVAKGLVEAMGGALEVESTVGTGTTFTIELPREQPMLAGRAPVAFPAGAPALAGDLLYIEDNPVNLELVQNILAQLRPGLQLRAATEGEAGVALAAERRPDLLLLDLNLPDMSGEDVLRLLRARPETADVPVLILSADSTSRNITRLLQTGADAYLTKPLEIPQFLDVLDRLLTRK